ncbi:MAG: tRNA glutamyl-Q(34) synthetase GluQRS [Sphaerotilus natans subsp. sulfidivorans]|uniref:tRNA glutamyl-Q(34) synthetase GluQRS n=1 Tax=Sphaerotilus sulfidivorans TaxID=639200 RepID=UPI0023551315|nr:tRNA glutamyl-Q(34) synthetase GluQRS [Sphaerotilus sulfidivorans]MCK6400471.1 tRNA glutamyl-Q(34) synthetase GluQRS [Sphaerotilus sulfidivorans]
MVAALASWLDARAHGGRWLVRIEDVDGPRCIAGAEDAILRQLADCGLHPDAPPLRQSDRGALYAQALERLHAAGLAYGCRCTRREIAQALQARGLDRERHGDLVYPGTCRPGGPQPVPWPEARAVRLLTCADDGRDTVIDWTDRRLGAQRQNVSQEVGDFVLRRADGLWAYQLAVVVDDAAQGVTDIVRGEDLADNTPRQILLRRHLGLPQPRHLHTPLVLAADGQKLSKQNGAVPVDTGRPAEVLAAAARALGLDLSESLSADAVRTEALRQWRLRLEQE